MSLREELKPDDWTETPFKYQRIEDGFLLYGVGINGVDDGGCNGDEDGATAPWRVVNGKWVNASDSAESDGFMTGDDDVIRFPIPDVKWHRPIAN